MNIYTNYNVKNINTNPNLNKQSNLPQQSYSNNTIQDNVSFKAKNVLIKGNLGAIKSFLKNNILDKEGYRFFKDYNRSQYLQYQLDMYDASSIIRNCKDRKYSEYRFSTNNKIFSYNIGGQGCTLQKQVLERYRMNPNTLFKLLQKKDLYGKPNIEGLNQNNLLCLISIFKETPSMIDALLQGKAAKIMRECIPENFAEVVLSLKNNPKVLDEILSTKAKKTEQTLMHSLAKEQNIDTLMLINDAYKDRPKDLLKLYSEKDKCNFLRFERTELCGTDGICRYEKSNRTPLEYLTLENLNSLKEKCPLLNDIKL